MKGGMGSAINGVDHRALLVSDRLEQNWRRRLGLAMNPESPGGAVGLV